MSKTPKVLIIDDVADNRRLLAKTIRDNTRYEVMLASEGSAALDVIGRNPPDLILLDIMMPQMDGFEVARELKSNPQTSDIPILFITALTDIEGISRAFECGGKDYITKPFNRIELLARVNSHMELKLVRDDLVHKNNLLANEELHLRKLVEEKTRKIENATLALVNALDNANYYNDTDTGLHIKRVSEYSALLAGCLVGEPDFVKRIRLYSSLHDVGKVGISDALLKKPDRYTEAEFEQMKIHVGIGARMLDDPEIDP
ncbi:MAG: response regulator, partial [Spirochaetales bacterium]|nr:response regulator [Spirochaetales bacterium]